MSKQIVAVIESSEYDTAQSDQPTQPRWTAHEQLLLLAALLFFTFVVVKSAWLSDDAFITLRTVRNFVTGYGLVWNVGERVQAYTHPLWMLLLSLTYFVTRDAYYGTLGLSLLVTLVTAGLLGWRVARSLTTALLGLLLLSLSKAFVDYSTSGLENPLTHLLLTLFVWIYCQQPSAPQRRIFGLALVTALALTNRLDTVLFFAPPLLVALWQARGSKTLLLTALGFAPLLLWELFSLFYYGFPLPNTAYAKLGVNLGTGELIQQGIYYLLNSLTVDPITLLTVALALCYPLLRQQHLAPLALGILLYVAYVVQIGGDFMSGRFFSAPFCAAVLVLVQADYPPLWQPKSWLLLVSMVVVGLLNPTQSPWVSRADYAVDAIDNKGIADERGHYYQRYGLLAANRANRLLMQGKVTGTAEPADFIHCGIGMRGFQASPYTHLVDFCGLADALIARLPTIYDPNWRIGHPIRSVPLGYMGTLRTGQNQLADPNLALFYDKLRLVIAGDLWDGARLREIWNFNRGRYDHWVDLERYRYPEIKTLTLAGAPQAGLVVGSLFDTDEVALDLNNQGVRLDLGQPRYATHLDVGLNCDYCEVLFFLEGESVAHTLINRTPLQLGKSLYSIVAVPAAAVERGYDGLRITPLTGYGYSLTHLDLLDWRAVTALSPTAIELSTLLRLYYHSYYRGVEPQRSQELTTLQQTLAGASERALWQKMPLAVVLALLQMPDPAIQALVEPHLPVDVQLRDNTDKTLLRYLGVTSSATVEQEGKRYLQLHLHFLVMAAVEKQYTAWFHIQSADPADEGEWMLYDYFPDPPIQQWQPGTLVEFAPLIELAPGDYELSFGFWTPNVRQRLYVDPAADVYWVDLGAFAVEELAK